MVNDDWSRKEVILAIQDYFSMLKLELERQSYNKTEHRNLLLPKLDGRSGGSVEKKHQNISAVLIRLGRPYINGYKPLGNFQQMLVDEVTRYLDDQTNIFDPLFEDFAQRETPIFQPDKIDFSRCLVTAPPLAERQTKEKRFRPVKINYLEKEQRNRTLGFNGEQFVINYENYRLKEAGREDLIRYINWTSRIKGDGAGYDILSKNIDGSDRLIEVKTTKSSIGTPIYLTATEVAFAKENPENFFLYRVFDFERNVRLFVYNGSYHGFCHLEPTAYRGLF